MNLKQIKAREQANKARIQKHCPMITESSGIYFLTREEDDFKYAYVGQAKHLLTRLAQHLSGYQHIDLSLKKHGLYSAENQTGWRISFICYSEELLDEREQEWVKEYASRGYQLRNKTSGSQDKGKFGIAENKPSKGYFDGVEYGYERARREVSKWFKKYLQVFVKDFTKELNATKNANKAMQKFEDFLRGGN